MKLSANTINRRLKPVVFLLLLLPILWLAYQWALAIMGAPNILTVNPIEYTNRYLGDWALKMIVGGLALTPLAGMTGSRLPHRIRRMVGLFAFSYVLLHVSSYVVLDHFFNWTEIGKDIIKRNFITVGMISLTLLTPMALTSTNKMVKRVGARVWKRIHRAIYVIGPLVVLHYNLMVKGNQLEPKLWAGALVFLLGYRFYQWQIKRRRRAVAQADTAGA